MSKRTKLLGAACGLAVAALASGAASAASLTGFAGDVHGSYGRSDANDCHGSGCDIDHWTLGGNAAAPLSDVVNLNIQGGAAYTHSGREHGREESWDFNAAIFHAGQQHRVGIFGNYETFAHFGNDTAFGLFGEWYFNNITVAAKGGWLQSGGTPNGGSGGGFFGLGATVYAMPNLAISAGFDYQNQNHGYSIQHLGRSGVHHTAYGVEGEFMLSEAFAASIFANVAFVQSGISSGGGDFDATVWLIGFRWYTGGGTLVDKHRNGTLRSFLVNP